MSGIDRWILPPEVFCLRKKSPRCIASALRTGVLLPPEDGLRQMIRSSGWNSIKKHYSLGKKVGASSLDAHFSSALPATRRHRPVRRLTDSRDASLEAGKGSRREVAVILNRVPAVFDAAHVGFGFTDVMGSGHCGLPVCSIIGQSDLTVAEFVAPQHRSLTYLTVRWRTQ